MKLAWIVATICIILIECASHALPQRKTPRIHVYDLPPHLVSPHGTMGRLLVNKIRDSEYYESDPGKADYFWIPGGGGQPPAGNKTGREFVISVFEHVRTHYPWWNRTMELRQARHVFAALSDDGAGESFDYDVNNLPPGKLGVTIQYRM